MDVLLNILDVHSAANIENIVHSAANIENIEKNIQNIENRSNFTGDEPGYKNFIDRLDKARADLKEAYHRMDNAGADLACARVNELDEKMKEWKRLNPEYLFDERLTAIYKDKDRDLTNARAE